MDRSGHEPGSSHAPCQTQGALFMLAVRLSQSAANEQPSPCLTFAFFAWRRVGVCQHCDAMSRGDLSLGAGRTPRTFASSGAFYSFRPDEATMANALVTSTPQGQLSCSSDSHVSRMHSSRAQLSSQAPSYYHCASTTHAAQFSMDAIPIYPPIACPRPPQCEQVG